MTDDQWRAAFVLCETAGDLDSETQRDYVHGATVDPEVESEVIGLFEELENEPNYPAAPDRRVGDVVGRYVINERIGQGGMGEVYLAEDTELKRSVALKFLPGAVGGEDRVVSQVIAEARLASRLNHPNIITVYELIETPWGLAIVMELVEGQSLRKLLKTSRLSTRRLIHIARQLTSALAAAHEKDIVHRDIKPENVMVREGGFVKILDFGLAQNIRDQVSANRSISLPVGTVRYMSPEQRAGRPATKASDIYSLALVLDEAGLKHPILSRMLSAEPDRRPTARDVELVLVKLDTPSYKSAAAALLAGLLLLATGVVYWVRSERPGPSDRLTQVTRYSNGHDISAVALSRNGRLMAYATIDGGFFVRDQSTGNVRELAGPEHLSCYQMSFAGNEQLLAVGLADGTFEAWGIPIDGRASRRLAEDVQMVAVSHDEKQIAWLDGEHHVWAGPALGMPARLLVELSSGAHVAALFWSGDDKQLWFRRVSGCAGGKDKPDALLNPSYCSSSELAAAGPFPGRDAISIGPLFFGSGFFTSSGELFFLRQDVPRTDGGYNLWRFPVNSATGRLASTPEQISHLSSVALSSLAGSVDGKRLMMIRTDRATHTYIAEWQAKPNPSLLSQRRLTVEESNTYPHAWSADNQWIIFESDETGNLELFRQNRNRRKPERLTYSQRENYMAQLTPDGKSILFMSSMKSPRGFTDLQLMRIPVNGGSMVRVPITGPWDEFRCGRFGNSRRCVLRATAGVEQTYYELDPVAGKGRELGRSTALAIGLGNWSLSSDAERAVIFNLNQPGCFTELQLDPEPSKRWQALRQIDGLTTVIRGMTPGVSKGEWLVSSKSGTRAGNQFALAPYFVDPSRLAVFGFVDAHFRFHLLEEGNIEEFGFFSNDGKHIAIVKEALTRNVWSFDR